MERIRSTAGILVSYERDGVDGEALRQQRARRN